MFTLEPPLILGSSSPRRREILAELGLSLEVVPADVDETTLPGEAPEVYVERIVRAKLEAVVSKVWGRRYSAVLVADTIVTVDREILGKPASDEDALGMLSRLSGRGHLVLTGYGMAHADGRTVARTITTEVIMRAFPERVLRAYVASGEGRDKAGSYAVQGLGAFLVERVNGSYSAVVGLPACEVVGDLMALGLLGNPA